MLYTISDSTLVDAPLDRCFLLSTSIDLVAKTLRMRPLSGRLSGLIQPNDQLLWHGWKFGLPHRHQTLITAYDRPNHFQDTMGRGSFQHFQHDHTFIQVAGQTRLHDTIQFSLPLGWAGAQVAKHIMVPYITQLLRRRLQTLKQVAESEEWRQYLPEPLQ
ncbi:SRPBCC family protein [Granulicella sp. dw_53]|uniref:SRPBCC family protein n=1 Tax=Granulicella sp. dw_53 TaxID=2719792 RepID=UPI001BD48D99|nr:SRPBCC family protein [Granulicella sp. dw_53]